MGDLNLDFARDEAINDLESEESGEKFADDGLSSQPEEELVADEVDSSTDEVAEPELEPPEPEGEKDEFADLAAIDKGTKPETPGGEEEKFTEAEFLTRLKHKARGEEHTPETLEQVRQKLSAGHDYTQSKQELAEKEKNYEQKLQFYQNQLAQQQQFQQPVVPQAQIDGLEKIQITEEMLDSEKVMATNHNKMVDARIADVQRMAQMESFVNSQASNANAQQLHGQYEEQRGDYDLPSKEGDPKLHGKVRDVVMGYLWANQQRYGNDNIGRPIYGISNALAEVTEVIDAFRTNWKDFDFNALMDSDKDAAIEIARQVIPWYHTRKQLQEKSFKSAKPSAPVRKQEEEKKVGVKPAGSWDKTVKNIGEAVISEFKF